MSKVLTTSNQENIDQFQTVKTIRELVHTTTVPGAMVLLEKYPVMYKKKEWKASKGKKLGDHISKLEEKQGIILLHLENKFVAYAKFDGKIYSLSAQTSWLDFIRTYLQF